MRVAAVAAHFGRDLEQCLTRIGSIIEAARSRDVEVLVFPDATVGGYLGTFADVDGTGLPPSLQSVCACRSQTTSSTRACPHVSPTSASGSQAKDFPPEWAWIWGPSAPRTKEDNGRSLYQPRRHS